MLACVVDASNAREQDGPRTQLTGQIELARLVDLCAERLGLNIEYDAAALRGQVTLRLGAGVTDQELWLLTNRVLASRGFATVQMPGEKLVSVVRLQDAPGLARIEPDPEDLPDPAAAKAGYTTVIVRLEHQPPRRIIEAVKLVLSRTGSQATQIGEADLVLLSDLTPRIEEAKRFLEMLDVPIDQPLIEKVPVEFVAATQLASLATAAAQARDAITGRPKRGKVTPIPDGTAVMLIAPPEERGFWLSLIAKFDAKEAVTTQTYAPRQFSVREVARLIEQSGRIPGPRGSGDQWRVVEDELTGTLIITATPAEHDRIETLFERLEDVPTEARRPVRAFPIRNRSVRDMTDMLVRLADAGVLESDIQMRSAPRREDATRPEGARWIGGVRPPEAPPEMSPEVSQGDARTDDLTREARDQRSDRETRPPRTGRSLTITADEGTNTIIAVGDPRQLAQLDELIKRLDVRQPQVMLEVLVLSLSESETLDLGVELQKIEMRGSTMIRLASLFGLGPADLVTRTTVPSPGQGATGVVLSPGDFSILLRALETINEGRSISLPKVLVNNNQVATLDSVRQEPFTSLNALDTVATTSFGGTLDAGTIVTVTPQIAEADHLLLDYSVSLSSFVGDSTDPALPPPRQQNRLASRVSIPDGYTVVVGGLELESDGRGVSQVPLLGRIPFIGEAFKSRSFSRNRSRFFVFIRANVLRHEGFEDLRYLSELDLYATSMDRTVRDWPKVVPRVIR